MCIRFVSISLLWPLIERNLMEGGISRYELTYSRVRRETQREKQWCRTDEGVDIGVSPPSLSLKGNFIIVPQKAEMKSLSSSCFAGSRPSDQWSHFFFFPFKPVFLPKSFRRLMMLCDNHFKLASFCQTSASVSMEVMGEAENFHTTTLWPSFVVFRCLILVRVARGIHWVRAGYTLVTGLFTLTFTPSVNLEWTTMLLLHARHARLPERQDQSSKEI